MHLIQTSPIFDNVDLYDEPGNPHSMTESSVSGLPSVVISSDSNTGAHNGVADSNGTVNVNLSVPTDVKFMIRLRNYGNSTAFANAEIRDNGTKIWDSHDHYANGFWIYSGGNAVCIGSNGIEQFSDIRNKEHWLVSTGGAISVHITNGQGMVNQDVVLEIIFRDNPA